MGLMGEFTPEEQYRIANGLCFRCGHEDGIHDESQCMGGEDTICFCDCFEEPTEGGRPDAS